MAHNDLQALHGAAGKAAFVAPLARALAILSVFSPQDQWLGTREIAVRAGTPVSTTARLLKSLAVLGYVRPCAQRRKYRLAAGVLALGYAANTSGEVQRATLGPMQDLADDSGTTVVLGTRDRLDVVVLESCKPQAGMAGLAADLAVAAGTRLSLAESPLGWALLAALPRLEHQYLLDNLERRQKRDWPRVQRRLVEAVYQVQETGFCTSLSEWDPDISTVAAPLVVRGVPPMAIACVGSGARMTRTAIARNLGPRLLGMVERLQNAASGDAPGHHGG